MTLTPDRWRQIRQVLELALEAPDHARAEVLARACGDDHELRGEVEAFLAAEAQAGGLLEQPVHEYVDALAAELAQSLASEASASDSGFYAAGSLAGHRLGPFRLVREVARGGMGTVYLAERDDGQFEQRVAVKVLRRGLDTDDIVSRFLAERRILAGLTHPNIAHLLDGGATEDGRPYLVMEYVDGRPINDHCNAARLSVEERLRLFLTVADAVRHAHGHLIVHRDLKPSNVLVTRDGVVKLLDFGIAKLLGTDLAASPVTRTGIRILTPEYATPEQVRGDAVTTGSDVYQLGLLLYELLTGRRAIKLEGRTPMEVERLVCELDPPPPSAVVGRARGPIGDLAAQAAAACGTTPDRLRRRLRGDLDAIVLRALEKDPARRYTSVEAMMADIRRHLAGRPVQARHGNAGYRLRRFLRRHRLSAAGSAALLVVLTAYVGTVSVQTNRVSEALATAMLETARAEEVTDFLLGLFEASRPEEARGHEVTALELLARGVERAESLTGEPLVQARLMAVIGRTYLRLGHYDEAEALYRRALDLGQRHLGPAHEELATTIADLAVLHRQRGDLATAETLQRQALAMRSEILGDHPELAVSLDELGRVLQDRDDFAGAEAAFREALDIRRRLLGDHHNETASSLNSVGLVMLRQGRPDDAERYLREALAINRARFGDEHPWVSTIRSNIALVHIDRGEWQHAETLLRHALDTDLRIHGQSHINVAVRLKHLATVHRGQGRLHHADQALRQAAAIAGDTSGGSTFWLARILARHASLHFDLDDHTAAREAAAEAVRLFRDALPPGAARTADAEALLDRIRTAVATQ